MSFIAFTRVFAVLAVADWALVGAHTRDTTKRQWAELSTVVGHFPDVVADPR